MMHECDRVGDAIWEHARTGADLPADVSRHIGGCPECARLLSDARRILRLAEQVIPVPESPDCRAEVMARISVAEPRRPVWAYACALLVVILIAGYALLREARPPGRIAQTNQPSPKVSPTEQPANPGFICVDPVPQRRTQCRPVTAQHHRPRVRHWVNPKLMVAGANTQQQSPVPRTPEDQPSMDRRPVAAVSVTWGAEPSESSSYAYTERDEATGETTTCRVEKSPGAVSIFMESKPSGQEPPSKGA